MPRRKQDQPKRLPSHVDGTEEAGTKVPAVEEDVWFGNTSDTPSESSFGDEALPEQDGSGESSAGCLTPDPRASLDLLGLDRDGLRSGSVSAQDTLSSMVSSLFGDASRALGSPMSSNLRRLLEAGEHAAQGRGGASPNVALSLSPSSNHAQQQLSALARKLAGSTHSATPSPMSVKLEVGGRFSPAADTNGGPTWTSTLEAWPPGGCSAPTSLSPDSAILKLKAAANAVLQDKGTAATLSCSSSASSSSSCSSSVSSMATEEPGRFDSFASPFSTQSASSTLAALSKKVSERGLLGAQPEGQQGTFLSLASMTSSAALLKEVAARAAGCLLSDKKEPPMVLATRDDVKPPADKKQKQNQNQTLDLLKSVPTTPKGKTKACSQGGSPDEGGKPFQCPVCGLVIKRKSYWKRHMVIHTGIKSHQCPLCPFRCARKDNLKSHMKVHQHQDRGETFQCEQCPFTSSRQFSLKLHMRCHQHCPTNETSVKDEVTTDTEDDGGASLQGASGGRGSPLEPDASRVLPSPGEVLNHPLVKEEPQEQEVSAFSSFNLGKERPGSVTGSPVSPAAASLFSPNMNAKTATDLLIKLSAANQKEALKGPVCVKEEPQAEDTTGAPQFAQKPLETGAKSGILCQDIGTKVASELLMKLSENKKDGSFQQVKAEPMEVDPSQESPSALPHMLGFGTLPRIEKMDSPTGFPDGLGSPHRTLFSEDISVKMASELLFKLSERVSKTKNHKDSSMLVTASPFTNKQYGQAPSDSISKACSSTGVMLHDSGESGADKSAKMAAWRKEEPLYPCGVCGKVFGSQQTLSHHLSVHTEEMYRCPLCPYTAKCRANLSQHLTVHAVEHRSTNTEDNITAVNAEKSQHSNRPFYYSCLMCGFQTEQKAHFVSHMSLHMDREQWVFSLCCAACDFVCGDEVEMKVHVDAGHAGLNPRSPLSETKSPSSSLSTLSDSVNSSETSEVAAPPSSASSQSSASSLSGSGAKEKPEKGRSSGGFECVFCTFVCEAKPAYERHLQAHLISRMFECDVCHEFLKTSEQLLEHKTCHAAPSGGLKVCEALWGPEQMKAAI
ncbi:hypothetical protein GJAV_G00063730 [Gymnothorax javanicus]|nr:hypothetical protein GJAV_G00063730 [Gymnothorax javanicus]